MKELLVVLPVVTGVVAGFGLYFHQIGDHPMATSFLFGVAITTALLTIGVAIVNR
jgi:putative exporter of polyketide antibiotics